MISWKFHSIHCLMPKVNMLKKTTVPKSLVTRLPKLVLLFFAYSFLVTSLKLLPIANSSVHDAINDLSQREKVVLTHKLPSASLDKKARIKRSLAKTTLAQRILQIFSLALCFSILGFITRFVLKRFQFFSSFRSPVFPGTFRTLPLLN